MQTTAKQMEKLLTRPQIRALTYALTEGSVGPGCDPLGSRDRITKRTISFLVDAGLLTATSDPCVGGTAEPWGRLTAWGETAARKAYEVTRGRTWDHPIGSLGPRHGPFGLVPAFKS